MTYARSRTDSRRKWAMATGRCRPIRRCCSSSERRKEACSALDGATKRVTPREQAVESGERKRAEIAFLGTQRALKKYGDLEQRLEVVGAMTLPLLLAHRIPQYRHVEVNRQNVERRIADDEVVKLGVSVGEPALVQRRQCEKDALGEHP